MLASRIANRYTPKRAKPMRKLQTSQLKPLNMKKVQPSTTYKRFYCKEGPGVTRVVTDIDTVIPIQQALNHPSEKVQNLVKQISELSFIEVAQFAKLFAKTFEIDENVSFGGGGAHGGGGGAPAQQAQAAPAEAAPEAPKKEAKKEEAPAKKDIKLTKVPDANKFKVLKEVRALKPGMNLMESKALVEGLPKIVMEGVATKEAEEWIKKLQAAGAEAELV